MRSKLSSGFLFMMAASVAAVIIFAGRFDNNIAPMEIGLAASCAVLLAAMSLNMIILKQPYEIRIGSAGVFFLLCSAFRIISIAWSPEPAYSIYECANFMIYLAVFFLIAGVRTSHLDRDRIASAIVAFAFVFSAHGIAQYFGLDIIADTSRFRVSSDKSLHVYSLFGNSNLLAGFLAVSFALSAGLFFKTKSHRSKVIFFISTATIIFAIALSNSRIGILSAAAAILILSLARIPARFSAVFRGAVFVVLIASIAVFSVKMWSGNNDKLRSSILRTMYISTGWSMFRDKPTGSGPGTFKIRYLEYQREYFASRNMPALEGAVENEKPGHPHNELIYLLAESGPAAAIFFAVSLLIPFTGVFAAGSASRALWGAASFSFFMISMTGFPLLIPMTGILWPVCAAMSDSAAPDRSIAPQKTAKASFILPALIAALSAYLIFSISYTRTAAAWRISAAKQRLIVGDDAGARQQIDAAINILPFNGEALFTAGALQMRAGAHGSAIKFFNEASRYSSDKNLEANRAAAQLALGRTREAEKRLVVMNETYPANRQFMMMLIDAQLKLGHFKAAEETAKRAVETYPDDDYLKTALRGVQKARELNEGGK